MKKRVLSRWMALVLMAAMPAFAGGCGSSGSLSQLQIEPARARAAIGQTVDFDVFTPGVAGPSAAWKVQPGGAGGTIDSDGVYTAPPTVDAGSTDVVIVETTIGSVAAQVTVVPVIAVTPPAAVVSVGKTVTLRAQVTGKTNPVVRFELRSERIGTIRDNGDGTALYEAPADRTGNDRVLVTEQTSGQSVEVIIAVQSASGSVIVH